MVSRSVFPFLAVVLACGLAGGAVSAQTSVAPAAAVSVPSTLVGEHYVPIHSSVRAGDGRTRVDLAVTLSVHNASETRALTVTRIDLFDGAGKRVEQRLATPVVLAPFATLEIFVAKDDVRAGTGANFIVGWAAAGSIAEPVIEAVMIGDFANQSYAFVSTGRRIETIEPGKR